MNETISSSPSYTVPPVAQPAPSDSRAGRRVGSPCRDLRRIGLQARRCLTQTATCGSRETLPVIGRPARFRDEPLSGIVPRVDAAWPATLPPSTIIRQLSHEPEPIIERPEVTERAARPQSGSGASPSAARSRRVVDASSSNQRRKRSAPSVKRFAAGLTSQ